MADFTSTEIIIGAVIGSGGVIGTILGAAKFLLDRNEKKAAKKKAELDNHVTNSAEMRRLDDLKADKQYERQLEINERLELDCSRCRSQLSESEKKIRLALIAIRSADKQLVKLMDCIKVGFQLKDVQLQADLLQNDIGMIEVRLTDE